MKTQVNIPVKNVSVTNIQEHGYVRDEEKGRDSHLTMASSIAPASLPNCKLKSPSFP